MKNKIKYAVIIFIIGGIIMYTRVNWQNSPSTATPVSADNLNTMDKGIADAHSQLADKANISDISSLTANKADKSYVDNGDNATNLRIDNLVIPISPENANVEVTDAHNSLVKNKNFLSLKDRLEESEEEFIQHKLDYTDLKGVKSGKVTQRILSSAIQEQLLFGFDWELGTLDADTGAGMDTNRFIRTKSIQRFEQGTKIKLYDSVNYSYFLQRYNEDGSIIVHYPVFGKNEITVDATIYCKIVIKKDDNSDLTNLIDDVGSQLLVYETNSLIDRTEVIENIIKNKLNIKKPENYPKPTLTQYDLMPLAVSDGVVYGSRRGYSVRIISTTDFNTFVEGFVFPMVIQKIVVSKTHIIVSSWAMGATAGEIWICPKEQGVNGTFTKVFTFPAGVGVPRHGGINAYYDDLRNIVVMCTYGAKGTENTKFAYMSTDGGVTFNQIFEGEGGTNYHLHDIIYDQYQDRIWIASGDYTSDKIYFSDDRGATWTIAHGTGYQATTIIPMPKYVLFGSDYTPVGIYRWDREIEIAESLKSNGDISKAMDTPHIVDVKGTGATTYSYGFYKENDDIAYIAFSGVGGTVRKTFLVATGDGGETFYTLFANGESTRGGLQVVAGKINGELIMNYSSDSLFEGTMKMNPVTWV